MTFWHPTLNSSTKRREDVVKVPISFTNMFSTLKTWKKSHKHIWFSWGGKKKLNATLALTWTVTFSTKRGPQVNTWQVKHGNHKHWFAIKYETRSPFYSHTSNPLLGTIHKQWAIKLSAQVDLGALLPFCIASLNIQK